MAKPISFGIQAENVAQRYLQQHGVDILTRNYRQPFGEIDIVAMLNTTLIFVEVRYRKNDLFGGAVSSISAAKQRKIKQTAASYLQQNSNLVYQQCRFDVIALSGPQSNIDLVWIKAAF